MPERDQANDVLTIRPADGDKYDVAVIFALKAAVRRAVEIAGGPTTLEAEWGGSKNKGRFAEWAKPGHPAMPDVREIANLERMLPRPMITEALAALHGCDVVKRPTSDIATAMTIKQVADWMKEAGEATHAAGQAITNPDCRKALRACVTEFRQAIRIATEFVASIEAEIEEAA